MDKWIQLQSSDGIDNLFPVGMMDLLWENGNPTNTFPAQNIELDLSDYSLVLVIFRWSNTDSSPMPCFALMNSAGICHAVYNTKQYRSFYIFPTYIEFKVGSFASATGTAMSSNNNYCIPTHIYGIRKTINDLT